MILPVDVKVLLDKLNMAGYEAYVVGGCVRDSLLGKKPKDWDITTNAKPEEVMEVFKTFNIIPTGLKHGTVTVMFHNIGYEITTYRVDGDYSDCRHPDKVTFTSNLADDLARRDFTINAMAYSELEGIVDIFGGVKDLRNGVVKCVGNAHDRFSEDALRILRAMRFASVLNFRIDADTKKAMLDLYGNLENVAKERINVEFSKMIMGKGNVRILREFVDIISFIIPDLKPLIGFEQHSVWHIYDIWEHTLCVVKNITNNDLNTYLAAILHDIGKPKAYTNEDGVGHFHGHYKYSKEMAESILRDLKYSNDVIEEVCLLVEYHDADSMVSKKYIRKMLNKMSKETFEKLLVLKRADILGQSNMQRVERLRKIKEIQQMLKDFDTDDECFTLKQLNLNGNDLIALGLKPCLLFKEILNTLLEKVINEEIVNDKDVLIAFVKENLI